MGSWIRCKRCGEYIPSKQFEEHECGLPLPEESTPLKLFSHKEMLDYLIEHPSEIEVGMQILVKEFPVFRGRIDLIGRDKDKRLCLIEVAHRSKQWNAYWTRKLRRYRTYLMQLAYQLFLIRDLEVRLLLKKTGKPTEDVL